MKNRKLLKIVFLLIIALVFIGPFLFITKFTFLSADDFCRSSASFENYFQNIFNWYKNHNGRYTNALLSYLPVYNLQIYRWILGSSILLLGITIFCFIKKVFEFFHLEKTSTTVFFIALVFYITAISQLPSIYEFFYWYAGTSAYMYSIILFLLFLIMLFNLELKNRPKMIIGSLIIILLNGNNEMLMGISNFLLIVILIKNYISNGKISKKILFFNIVSWVSSLVVIFSPGSINRQTYYPEGANFLYSLKSAVLSSGMFTLKSLIEFPYILLFIGLILFVIKTGKNNEAKNSINGNNPIVLFIISFIGLVSVFIIPYYATGILKVNDGRIGNIIHIIFWIILFINLINFSLYFQRWIPEYKRIIPNFFPHIFLMGFLLLILMTNINYKNIYEEISKGDFEKYKEDVKYRERLIENSEESKIVLKRISGTKTIQHYDITKDSTDWVNSCYMNMINNKYDKNFKSIVIE